MIGFVLAIAVVVLLMSGVFGGMYSWYFVQLSAAALDKITRTLRFNLGVI